MKVWVSGSRNGRPWPAPGEDAVVGAQEGADMCAAGLAEPVAERQRVETRETKSEDLETRGETAKPEPLVRKSDSGKSKS